MRKNQATCITGKYVLLVPYKRKHVLRYHEWMKSPELQHLTASEPLTLEDEYRMQKQWSEDEDKCTFIILDKTIFYSTNNEIEAMIGDTNLFFNDTDDQHTAEIEIMIAETEYRGKRRGFEATILMLRYGVEALKVKKYRAKIGLDNTKSIRMFEKLRFSEVGRSEAFQEITLERDVDHEWINWLHGETPIFVQDQCYNS